MAGGTDEAPKRTFGCALATRSKITEVSHPFISAI